MGFLYDVAEGIYGFMMSGPPFPADLVYIAVALIPVILIHELGHAFEARERLGVDVQVDVGNTGRLGHVKLGGVTASLNALSNPARSGAGGSASFDASLATVHDVFWIALAGPLASLGQTIVCAVALSFAPEAGVLHDLLWAMTLGGVFGVLNLIPLELVERRDKPPVATDGRLMLDALRLMRTMRELA